MSHEANACCNLLETNLDEFEESVMFGPDIIAIAQNLCSGATNAFQVLVRTERSLQSVDISFDLVHTVTEVSEESGLVSVASVDVFFGRIEVD